MKLSFTVSVRILFAVAAFGITMSTVSAERKGRRLRSRSVLSYGKGGQYADPDNSETTSPAPSSSPTMETALVGCFWDGPKFGLNRTMDVRLGFKIPKQDCFAQCAAQNYDFAAFQDGRACWCGYSGYDELGPADGKCTSECASGDSGTCGGWSANEVYALQVTSSPSDAPSVSPTRAPTPVPSTIPTGSPSNLPSVTSSNSPSWPPFDTEAYVQARVGYTEFAAGQGIDVTGLDHVSNTYTIRITDFKFNVTSFVDYYRLINFRPNSEDDNALFFHSNIRTTWSGVPNPGDCGGPDLGHIDYYHATEDSHQGKSCFNGTDPTTLVITRNGFNGGGGKIVMYLNDETDPELEFRDVDDSMVVVNGTMHFFADNTIGDCTGEEGAGSVGSIEIWSKAFHVSQLPDEEVVL